MEEVKKFKNFKKMSADLEKLKNKGVMGSGLFYLSVSVLKSLVNHKLKRLFAENGLLAVISAGSNHLNHINLCFGNAIFIHQILELFLF